MQVPLKAQECGLHIYYQPPTPTPKENAVTLRIQKTSSSWVAPAVLKDHQQSFNVLNSSIQWKRQNFVVRGTRYLFHFPISQGLTNSYSYLEPRDTAWYADPGCHYSYRSVNPHDVLAWTPELLTVRPH